MGEKLIIFEALIFNLNLNKKRRKNGDLSDKEKYWGVDTFQVYIGKGLIKCFIQVVLSYLHLEVYCRWSINQTAQVLWLWALIRKK